MIFTKTAVLPHISRRFTNSAFALAIIALVATYSLHKYQNERSALWQIVSTQCVPGQLNGNNPFPCKYVDLQKGYAVVKDKVGKAQYLLIPTVRIPGIESEKVMTQNAENYWEDAWEARKYIFQAIGRHLSRDDIGLAINSSFGRTQDQLHIHIDCLRQDVKNILQQHIAEIGENWSRLNASFNGTSYLARRLSAPDLSSVNPFSLLATNNISDSDMDKKTLVITGHTFPDGQKGFILLSDTANPLEGKLASGEELLDHNCVVANAR